MNDKEYYHSDMYPQSLEAASKGMRKAEKSFRPSGDRGFHHHDAVKAAEELRMEGKGSHDPTYPDSKKNK